MSDPQNDEKTLYIYTGMDSGGQTTSFVDLMEQIYSHFGEDTLITELDITSERFHTRCIYYDLYDPFDHDCYLVITKKVI